MKKPILIPAFFIVVLASAFIQAKPPVKKIYGYKQADIPGNLPTYSNENDIQPTPKTKSLRRYNYWFYLEISKPGIVNITGLWIYGIAHDTKTETINELPVKKIIFTGMDKNDTAIMVPYTKNKVLLIYPSDESKDTTINSKYITGLTSANELVIGYVWKNKKYYTTVEKITELRPEVRP
ncbi:MAG TPA: hypothetical protein VJ765_08715 [Chitinophagaceae bacterium]|nr:hypothetical protein [Chitinophagaceae bacterium]